MPTGGLAESFHPRWYFDEGCTGADWLRLNLMLGEMTENYRKASYSIIFLPRSLKAAVLGRGRWNWRGSAVPWGFATIGSHEAYWCCDQHVAHVFGDVLPYI